jgi:O-antigen/teichoic acid export membrane protein
VKQLVNSFVRWVHFRVFKREMGATMREFFQSTVWSFAGVVLSAGIFFVLNVTTGRLLGPVEYGRYNLVIAIAASVSVFMGAGFDITAIKYISQFSDTKEKNAALSNSLLFVVPFAAAVAALLVVFRNQTAWILHTDGALIVAAVAFTLIYTYKNLLDGFVKAFKRFPFQAAVKIAESLVALCIFLLLFKVLPGEHTYQTYLYALGSGGVISILLFLLSIRRNVRWWSKEVFKEERSYLRTFQLFTVVGVVMTSIDRFFVAKYLGAEELGMYSAYLLSATIIVAQLILVVDNVFFPMVNQVQDKKLMLKNLDRFFSIAFLPTLAATSLVSYLIILLFGNRYAVNWLYIVLVSFIAFLQIVSSLFISLVASSPALFRVSTRINYAKPIVIGSLYALTIILHKVSIPSVMVILAISYVYDILNCRFTFYLIPFHAHSAA